MPDWSGSDPWDGAAAWGEHATAGSAAFSGEGTLTASGSIVRLSGDVALSGSGTLTSSNASVRYTGSAAFSGDGSLSTSNARTQLTGSAAFSGQGTLTTSGIALGPVTIGSAEFDGTGTLTASGAIYIPVITGSAAFAGSGTLTATGTKDPGITLGAAAFDSDGTLTVVGEIQSSFVTGTAALGGYGELSVFGRIAQGEDLIAFETTFEAPGGSNDLNPYDDAPDFNNYPEDGYRYFTFDIMTDELLSEVPINDVTFSVKLGAVGEFSGTVPVGGLDLNIDIYGATMPMRTALYVLRGKRAVWGGIIWSRSYNANDQTLSISAGTWESYLFRRYMWHTYLTRDDIDQFEVVRQMLRLMRNDFEYIYIPEDNVIPLPEASKVDIFMGARDAHGKTQEVMGFDRSEMKSFGEALTDYASNVDGFEWYFVIDFNERAMRFRRRLQLLKTPPALLSKGSQDPPVNEENRPGVDTYLFEFPGNIASLELTEDGDNAATRQFVVGGYSGSVSSKAAKPIGSWNNMEYINAGYPLIENVESSNHPTTSKPERLNKLATVYGRDAAPPIRLWNVTVVGNMDPFVGTYRVGHWCRLVVHDEFIQRSLRASTDFDPLGGVVKRIVGYSVSVPNGPQVPEMVTLELEDDPTVSFDLTGQQAEGSPDDERGPYFYGSYMPNAASTGVPQNSELTKYNEPDTDTVTLQDGEVIADKIIYGDIQLPARMTKQIILRRCRLVGGRHVPNSATAVVDVERASSLPHNLRMVDVEIAPRTPCRTRDGIRGRQFEAVRVHIRNVVQGIILDPGTTTGLMNVTVQGCLIEALLRVDSRKSRAFTHLGGVGVTVKGNRFEGHARVHTDDFTGDTSSYLVTNEFADEVIFLTNDGGGFDERVVYDRNYIIGGTVQLLVDSNVSEIVYKGNRHFRRVAESPDDGYPGYWIRLKSRDTQVHDLLTNVWQDGAYRGSMLSEPRDLGIHVDE